MKNWSKKGDPADVDNLLDPLAKMLRKIYKEKENVDIGFDYKGYRVFGDHLPPDERFCKDYLEFILDDQGYDLIDNVLVTAFQYGIEQGTRINKNTVENVISALELSLELQPQYSLIKAGLACARNLLPITSVYENIKNNH